MRQLPRENGSDEPAPRRRGGHSAGHKGASQRSRTGRRTWAWAIGLGALGALAGGTSTVAQLEGPPSTGQLVLIVLATVLSGAFALITTLVGMTVVNWPARSQTQEADESTSDTVFVHSTSADHRWMEWLRQQLNYAGYTVYPHGHETSGMSTTSTDGRVNDRVCVIVLVSAPMLAADDAPAAAVPPSDPGAGNPIWVRVDRVSLPAAMADRIDVDLVGLGPEQARDALLRALTQRGHPASYRPDALEPDAPYPGLGPRISNLRPANPNFTGREGLLDEVSHALFGAPEPRAVALCGMGGVGKTQLALEYAHRFASRYEITWWVPAERTAGIVSSLQRLARRLGVPDTVNPEELFIDLWTELRARQHWLLVFDSADSAESLEPYWPTSGTGHILVTSRNPTWQRLSQLTFDVKPPAREEAIEFLCRCSGDDDEHSARTLAELLGDLPLALAQAAAYVDETRTTLAYYREQFVQREASLLEHGVPLDYQRRESALTAWSMSIDQAEARAPGSAALLTLVCFLACDDIPRELPSSAARQLPATLAERVGDPLRYDQMVRALAGYSLLTATADRLDTHHLVQVAVRAGLDPSTRARWAGVALTVVSEAFPEDPRDLAGWADCNRLLPHALAVCDLAEELAVAPEQTADLLRRAGHYLDLQGDSRHAEPLLERALRLHENAHGPTHPIVAGTLRALAMTRFHRIRIDEARAALERSLAIQEAAFEPDDERIAHTLADFAEILRELPDLAAAEAASERALRIAASAYGPDDPRTATFYQCLGVVRWRSGRLEAARRQHGRALGIQEGTGDPLDAEVAESSKYLGLICRDMCRFGQAELHLRRAVEVAEKVYGRQHLSTLDGVMHLADVRRLLGEPADAAEMLAAVRDGMERRLGPNHADIAGVKTKLGATLRDMNRLEDARRLLVEAAETFARARGDDHPYMAETYVQLGPVRRLLGDASGALADLRRAESIFAAAYGRGHPALAEVYEYLVPLLREKDEQSEADRLAKLAVGLRDRAADERV